MQHKIALEHHVGFTIFIIMPLFGHKSGVPYEYLALTAESAEPRLSNRVLTSMRIHNRFHDQSKC